MSTSAYEFKPPFEVYNNGLDVADADGHLCSAESPEIAQALVEALTAATERQETEQLFELQAEADRRAVAAWKAAHPDRPLTSPDRCDMVVWLMEELAEARETIRLQHATILSQANALQEAARRRLFSN
jgi:hypothetical protein